MKASCWFLSFTRPVDFIFLPRCSRCASLLHAWSLEIIASERYEGMCPVFKKTFTCNECDRLCKSRGNSYCYHSAFVALLNLLRARTRDEGTRIADNYVLRFGRTCSVISHPCSFTSCRDAVLHLHRDQIYLLIYFLSSLTSAWPLQTRNRLNTVESAHFSVKYICSRH